MTDLYAVIGNPIGHTKSPFIHKTFAKNTQQNLDYIAIEGILDAENPDAFKAQVLALFKTGGLLGLNVTAPFKLDALALSNIPLERAELAGASNCLKLENNQIVADNFDGIGLLRDIEVNLRQPFKGKRILVLGAGGAARGALMPFLNANPSEIIIVNRTLSKAQDLAKINAVYGNITACGYNDLTNEYFDIVINATSCSLRGELPPVPVPTNVFKKAKLAYELAYGKGKTPFLKLAEAHSDAILKDGVGMLVEQAAEAFVWWRGVRPNTEGVIKQMTIPLI
jgi:shikimate dehydrogenase